MRNLKKMFILCSLALVFTTVLADVANADVMGAAADKAIAVFTHVRGIIYIVGGFGLVGIAFQAIFGKVKWSWFAGLAVGLGIVAAADAVIQYAAGAQAGAGVANDSINDTFESGEGVAE